MLKPFVVAASLAASSLLSTCWQRAEPGARTESLGAFVTPVSASASSVQAAAGRTATKLMDGSGWGETSPGSGVYVHSNRVADDGGCMWNGDPQSWLLFDLGRVANLRGFYVWNYNEDGGWHTRGVKDLDVSVSEDGSAYRSVGRFTLAMAPGTDNDPGQAVPFGAVIRARYVRWQIVSNYRGGENSGLAEVRFADADRAPEPARPWVPLYPRPTHPTPGLGRPLAGAENIVYPADAGVVDVTRPPYNAKGDGVHDDTAAIQKALSDHPNQGAIIYLPNGIYLVSDTLRWPHGRGDGDEEKNTGIQGQSRGGAVLKLKDACSGFASSRRPKPVIWTGSAPAQRFGNEVRNLTIDTGAGNPGACGLQFIASNQGGVYDVSIVSGDGQGVCGLDMGYTDEQGPCLIKNVKVTGFDTGVRVATSVASETFEHIELAHQNRVGLRNDGQPCTVRGLVSLNAVTAIHAAGGFTTLVGCDLKGRAGASDRPAVVSEAGAAIFDLKTTGYRVAIRRGDSTSVKGPNVTRWLSKPASSLFASPDGDLRLPVRETPVVPWDDPSAWARPATMGAEDDAPAIQKAIDSGATTVYLPRGAYRIGTTIVIRGKVRRIVGCRAWLEVGDPLSRDAKPLFRFADGAAPVVVIEGLATGFSGGPYWFVEHDSFRTLVLRRLMINFQAAEAYRTGPHGSGDLFIEDVVGRYFRFRRQKVWARQFNPEGDGVHIENDGGTVWVLGLKTEGGGPLLDARGGSSTEILGGLSYTVGDSERAPMFVLRDSRAAISFSEVCYTGKPMPIVVRETQRGETREVPKAAPEWQGHFARYVAMPPR